jgi:hypothetical protein
MGTRVMMTTVAEAYFLVRVGSWGEDDLDDYIRDHMSDAHAEGHEEGYQEGLKAGLEEGLEQGLEDMYKQALDAIKCLR